MSIVKDLIFLAMFIFLVWRYVILFKSFKAQREYFVQTLSHDLRVSILAQIRGLEFLLKNANTISFQNELIDDINKSSKFSLDMINMLLNSFKYDMGERVLKYETFDLIEIFKSSCEALMEEAMQKNVILYKNCEPKLFINADREGVNKVISILLSTALANSSRGEQIVFAAFSDNNQCRVSIKYKGKSLSEEECRRMFTNKSRFSTVGHGVKMFLCKKIVDFHKGKILVTNLGENVNEFTIFLPNPINKNNIDSQFFLPFQTVKS